MLKRQMDRPMPRGFPPRSFSVLNSQSAVCRLTLSGHSPMRCILQASDAPKPSMVWRGVPVSISKCEAVCCACIVEAVRKTPRDMTAVRFM